MPLSLVMLWLELLNKDSLVGHSSLRQILREFFVVSHSKKSLSYFKKKTTYFKRNILKIRENFLGEW